VNRFFDAGRDDPWPRPVCLRPSCTSWPLRYSRTVPGRAGLRNPNRIASYLGRDPRVPVERAVADAVARALRADSGLVLAFLPGAAEIRRTEALLRDRSPLLDVMALSGAPESDVQARAIAPALPSRRKVVLATAIAETSLL
jgi:HrpA-like RNA helicase